MGLPLVELEGFEADDLIGTLAREGAEQGADVFIVSGDEDLFQLVNDQRLRGQAFARAEAMARRFAMPPK